jgi:hypothetical protein
VPSRPAKLVNERVFATPREGYRLMERPCRLPINPNSAVVAVTPLLVPAREGSPRQRRAADQSSPIFDPFRPETVGTAALARTRRHR